MRRGPTYITTLPRPGHRRRTRAATAWRQVAGPAVARRRRRRPRRSDATSETRFEVTLLNNQVYYRTRRNVGRYIVIDGRFSAIFPVFSAAPPTRAHLYQ